MVEFIAAAYAVAAMHGEVSFARFVLVALKVLGLEFDDLKVVTSDGKKALASSPRFEHIHGTSVRIPLKGNEGYDDLERKSGDLWDSIMSLET